jgi:hypothetical protein
MSKGKQSAKGAEQEALELHMDFTGLLTMHRGGGRAQHREQQRDGGGTHGGNKKPEAGEVGGGVARLQCWLILQLLTRGAP